MAPASAQVQPGLGLSRPFPEAALRGTLSINTASEATLNGKTIRMAPGMRLFSPQNTLVMAHTVLGQTFKVNYVLENSTGMLHAAWSLTEGEAATLHELAAEYGVSAERIRQIEAKAMQKMRSQLAELA